MKRLLVSAVFVICITGTTFAGSNGIVRFADEGSRVIVTVDGISSFQGSSSAVYSQAGKTHRMGISDLEMIGPVRHAMAETPFGNASVSEATFGSQDSPFEYSLTLKNMESFEAFTVQAVFHNRSDSDINLAAFDLIDTRKGSGGAFKVANANDWLVTSLMENMSAVSLADASKSMREAAMIYHRNGQGFLVGPVGPAEAYTRVQAVEKAILATVSMDNVLVPAGQSRRSEEMLFIFEAPAVATDIWTRWVAVTHGARTHRGSVYGWCSWYDRTTNIDETHVSNITKVIGDHEDVFGKGVIQIDDGYQRMDGDWRANDKFPSGMAAVAKQIRDIGCMPGVWFAPLMINPDHPWIKENPDAIQRNAKGIESFMNPNRFHPAGAKWINPSHPESKKFLASIIRDARRRGFQYIKIDFNGIGSQFVDPTKTRLQVFRELYQTYRQAAGEDMYILSCLGGPERGAVGYVDAARIAMDSHPAHFQGCLSKVLRTQIFHGVWWSANDPDVSYLAEKLTSRNLGPTPEGVGMWRTWHSVVALVGGTAMVSEPLDAPDAKQLWRHYSIMRPASAEPAKLLTLGVSRNNEIFGFAAKRPYGDFVVYNLYNSTKEPVDITLDFSQAELPGGVKCAVFDFWDNRFVGVATDQYSAVNVSPFSSKLLRFTPVDRADTGSPILIGSNLHLSMGATEIRNLSVTKSKVIIELNNAGAMDGSLTFYSLRPLEALSSNGCNVKSVEKKGDNIWQVNISDRKWAKEQNITLHYSENCEDQAGVNLAPLASVSGPGKDLRAVVDGVKQQDGVGEWIGGGAETWTGRRSSPKGLQLAWQRPQKINKIVLYDRTTLDQHFASVTVRFSDGSKLEICGIPNDGSPKTVVFEPRTITGFTLDGVDGMGLKQGFSEIECYYDPDAPPDEGRKKEYTDWVSYVDPTIETTRGRWFFCTPGSRPFGMVCAAAYTRNSNGGGGGYNYNGEDILGFANIHAWILSGINIMPTTGEVNPNLGEEGWKSKFSHETEIIEPGYHKVFLDRYQTQVEYTSTDRVAFYRMTYKEAAQAQLLLQLGGYVGNVSYVDGHAKWVSPTRVEGFHGMTDRVWNGPKLNHVFFVMEFDRPITQMDGWKGTDEKRLNIMDYANPVTPERLKQDKRKYVIKNLPEEQAGVAMAYDAAEGDVVQVKIGMSYTSIENARKNLEGECPHWDFDRVKKEARAEWNERLGQIAVKGGEEKTRVKFYTDLWHTQLGRHKIDDLNGDYPSTMGQRDARGVVPLVIQSVPMGADGQPLHHMYNHDSLWLTMWNLNILWGIGWPEMLDEFSASLMQYARVGGMLPRGPCGGAYTGIMTGSPATSLIASTYQKNLLTKVDVEEVFVQMRKDHMPRGMMGANHHYLETGWLAKEAGRTIQYNFEDWALAQMAADLGKIADVKTFTKRSTGWRTLIHPEIGLAFPKNADGSWMHTDPFTKTGWVESNAWQGTWDVSHDIQGLAKLLGGSEQLCQKLNFAFEKAAPGDFYADGMHGYLSYVNQPSCSSAHVFNHAGQPWLSQKWARAVSRQTYGAANPNMGYGGCDEDQGQMGGVSALMKLGLFSLRGTCSKEPIYEITAPEFDEITIALDPEYYPGTTFTIKAYGNSDKNCYIQKARLNGQPLDNCWFYHKDFAKGGLLELWLGPKPNKQWGNRPE